MPVTIFISYAADDPQWPAAAVKSLASKLEARGADVLLDQWEVEKRGRRLSDKEWRDWMRDGLARTDRVLSLCSTRYAELWSSTNAKDATGRGVAFESFELAQRLYDSRQLNDGHVFLYKPENAPEPPDLHGRCPPYSAPDHETELIEHLFLPTPTTEHDAWVRRLRAMLEEERTSLYVPLAGRQQHPAPNPVRLPQSVLRHVNGNLQRFASRQTTEHPDVLYAVTVETRALVLGEPGAGKTFALLKVLEHELDAGRVPVWVKLNHWLEGELPFEHFVAREAPDLGTAWTSMLDGDGRGHLLLDGLNELPLQYATQQRAQIATWLKAHPQCGVLVSCREEDLPTGEFEFLSERLLVRPLRARQIRTFVHNYYDVSDENAKEDLFWRLAGNHALRDMWASRPSHVSEEALDAFIEGELEGAPWLPATDREGWLSACQDPGRTYSLAINPYLLLMLLNVWALDRETPIRQRVDLFEAFTSARLQDEIEKRHDELSCDDLQDGLASLAARLQRVAEKQEGEDDAGTVSLPWHHLDEMDRHLASLAQGAGLMRREGAQVRFRHQLLQEFYVARYLHRALVLGESTLLAVTWGDSVPLWERSGWNQPFLLLAEYQHTSIPEMLASLARIQPEVAGAVWQQTRQRSPSILSDTLAEALRDELTAKMLPAEPSAEFPEREAAFGRGLGRMHWPDGRPLDQRPGVWGWYDSERRCAVVDIDWVTIPAGRFIYQGKLDRMETFSISRYPVTVSQFRAFVDDPQGFANDRCWNDVSNYSHERWNPSFPFSNHPCTDVDWWQARAFCHWLSVLLVKPIALPTERQWERAAAGGGSKAREFPWKGGWKDGRANAGFVIDQTSAVGMFPLGASEKEGVHELAGNVWEWTSDLLGDGTEHDVHAPRAVRGGSWGGSTIFCSAISRGGYRPDDRDSDLGFRVVCCPIQDP